MIKNILYRLSFLILFVNELSAFENNVQIVAKVNNHIITNIDLDNRYLTSIYLSNINVKSDMQKNILQKQILQQMIDEKLQMLEIAKNNINLDEQSISNIIDDVMKNNGFDPNELKKRFLANQLSYQDYQDQIKHKILFSELVKKNIYPNINVKNSQINELLEVNNIKNNLEFFLISEIYIAPGNNSHKIAQTLFDELKSGGDFKKLSDEFSDSTIVSFEDNSDWISEIELNPKLYQSIKDLQIADFSNPIELNSGYYIFKILDKKQSPNDNIDNIEQIKDIIFKRQAAIAIRSYMIDLRKNNNIIIYR